MDTFHVRFTVTAVFIALGLFLALVLSIELGRRLGLRKLDRDGHEAKASSSTAEGVVYALLSLLIGFTFNGAAGRFDHRRELIVQEISAASTAWQRIDALPADVQPGVRTEFKKYLDAVLFPRVRTTDNREEAIKPTLDLLRAQDAIWSLSMQSSLTPAGEKARMLLLPSLNEMFDAVDAEHLARRTHLPLVIFVMLGIASVAGALFVGYAMAADKGRNWLYVIGVSATISVATYVIIDMEFPRLGVIRVDEMDRAFSEFRQSLN